MTITIQSEDTLYSLFQKRVVATPSGIAYHQFDDSKKAWRSYTWQQIFEQTTLYRAALLQEGLQPGDRVAMMLGNRAEWVIFDQAAAALGLVTVPVFSGDNAQNCAYVIRDSGAKLLLVGNKQQLRKVISMFDNMTALQRVVSLNPFDNVDDPRVCGIQQWLTRKTSGKLPDIAAESVEETDPQPGDLATIIYTSGTTGNPKGVMLSHKNIVKNIEAVQSLFEIGDQDIFVSFLPLSHTFERTVGYYFTMTKGAQVVFSRSIATLMNDIKQWKPTVLIAVPRLYERVADQVRQSSRSPLAGLLIKLTKILGEYRNNNSLDSIGVRLSNGLWRILDRMVAMPIRAAFGGRLRFAISGGAALDAKINRMLSGFGIHIYQGYGMTESAPIISVNYPGNNVPESVGPPIPGVEVCIRENNEILTRSECVMLGYWHLDSATQEAIDQDGWLHTGDMGKLDNQNRIYITGRIKEIIVMDNGEKVPPVDMEIALMEAPIIEQAMVYGEGRPFLIALVVLEEKMLTEKMKRLNIDSVHHPKLASWLKACAKKLLAPFPGYARVRHIVIAEEPWTIDNDMLTSTLKLKRRNIIAKYSDKIEETYRRMK